MISFEEAIEMAKDELNVDGWTDDWDEVIDLAKEIYWKNDEFKLEKTLCLEEANGKCEICESSNCLTMHHIYYGIADNLMTEGKVIICVCSVCHNEIHKLQKEYGFVSQVALQFFIKFPDGATTSIAVIFGYENISDDINSFLKDLRENIKENKIKLSEELSDYKWVTPIEAKKIDLIEGILKEIVLVDNYYC